MLSFFQRIFSPAKKAAPAAVSAAATTSEPAALMPSVEVARLNLCAILGRLPEELRPVVLKMPPGDTTVALPVSTIVKQLPAGAVKVSLATLHRQAPAGVFGPLPPGDKRLVDVPLAEVFRHVSPHMLKRRADQRPAEGLESEFNLFGNAQQPYQLAPTAPEEAGDEPAVAPEPAAVFTPARFDPPPLTPTPQRVGAVLEIDEPAEAAPISAAAPIAQRVIAPPPELVPQRAVRPEQTSPAMGPKADPAVKLAPPPGLAPALQVAEDQSIGLPLERLSSAWPEAIRNELASLGGAEVALPTAQVTAGLARGRVSFTWGQIRSWLRPSPAGPSAVEDATELTLPLKVVAPVFLVSAKKKPPVVTAFETDIPALFNDRRAPEPLAAPPGESEARAELSEANPASETLTPPAAAAAAPRTVGELFGEPQKVEWTPAELVVRLAHRPGIAGAVVALQEGLLVAHSLPADVKSEVIAAFLPQIFARLNQYSGEMKLGEVDDLLFTTHGAHCQIYRLGFVYFAVLGKPGEPLPWTELRLVADELARQTQAKN